MKQIRAIGFDLDGTLLDHHGASIAGIDSFVASLGGEPSERIRELWFSAEEAEFERWRAGTITFQEQRRNRVRVLLSALDVDVPRNDADVDALFERYLTAYRGAWRCFDGVHDLLRSLRDQGYLLGILTNGAQQQQTEKLQVTGLESLVDVVCISAEIGFQKPDLGAFATLTDRLGVAPGECLFVGDNPSHDIEGAGQAGMPTLLVDHRASTSFNLTWAVNQALI